MRKVHFLFPYLFSPELEIEHLYDHAVENPSYEDK